MDVLGYKFTGRSYSVSFISFSTNFVHTYAAIHNTHNTAISFPRIAIIGGAGTAGSAILTSLLPDPSITKLTLVTRSTSAHTFAHPATTVIVPSYADEAALAASFRAHDIVISALSGAAAECFDPILLAAAIKTGVRRFMPSEYTLDVCHPLARELGKDTLLEVKQAFADELERVARSGAIEYTTLVTGGLLDWGVETGFIGFDVRRCEARLFDAGANKATGCTAQFVGEAVRTVVGMPAERTRNRRVRVAEVGYDGKRVLEALERTTGRKWTVRHVSTDEVLADGRRALVEGDAWAAYVGHVLKLNFDGSGAAYFEDGLEWDREGEFAMERKTLDEIVGDAVKKVYAREEN